MGSFKNRKNKATLRVKFPRCTLFTLISFMLLLITYSYIALFYHNVLKAGLGFGLTTLTYQTTKKWFRNKLF